MHLTEMPFRYANSFQLREMTSLMDNENCPKHRMETTKSAPSAPDEKTQATSNGNGKKREPKEIMKKRRERAICIDRVSR